MLNIIKLFTKKRDNKKNFSIRNGSYVWDTKKKKFTQCISSDDFITINSRSDTSILTRIKSK